MRNNIALLKLLTASGGSSTLGITWQPCRKILRPGFNRQWGRKKRVPSILPSKLARRFKLLKGLSEDWRAWLLACSLRKNGFGSCSSFLGDALKWSFRQQKCSPPKADRVGGTMPARGFTI